MVIPLPFGLLVIGLVMIAVSVPLIAGIVPMNRWYGVRTRKAFVSEENWYELNTYGGKLLVAFGAFLVVVALIGFAVAPDPRSPWAPVFVGAPLLLIIPVLGLIRARGKRLPG